MQRLPYDIFHNVIEFVDWLPTLIALTLVSREVKVEVDAVLWRYLGISLHDERSMIKCAALVDNDRGRHVRELRISLVKMFGGSTDAHEQVIRQALQTTVRLLELIPNVERLHLIGARANDYEMDILFTALSRPECLPRVRVVVFDHSICAHYLSMVDRMWRSHPTLVATHVRHPSRIPRLKLRRGFIGLEGCSQCPSSGAIAPSFIIDDFMEIDQAGLASSLKQLSTPPEYACFGHWAPLNIMTPILQSLPALKTLHIATNSRWDSSHRIGSILDLISTLANLEEFVWSKGASVMAQAEVFIRYKTGRLPTSLRRLVFTWTEGQKNNNRTYERKDLDDSRWSLLSDDWSRSSRKVGNSVVPLIVQRHAEL